MSETGLLKDNAYLDSFRDVSILATTGVFVLPNVRSALYLDEPAKSSKMPNEEEFPPLSDRYVFPPKEKTETGAQTIASKVPGIHVSRFEKFMPWNLPPRETDWIQHLADALLDDDNWDQLVHQAPEKALTRWITAKVLSHEEPIWVKPSSTAGADRLLKLLIDSPSLLRNEIYSLLVRFCTPRDILDASLAQYEQTCQEQYLLQAISLLERIGKEAWPTLQWLARSERHDCELFVGLIARCEQVPVNKRISAIRELAHNPYKEVRSAIFEQLSEFDEDGQRPILEILAKDDEPEIREEAEQDLAELG